MFPLHFLVVFTTVIERRHAGDLFESAAKRFRVVVADVVHHFGDVFAARFKTFFGGFDFYALDVFRDSVVRGSLKSAFERAATDVEH